MGMASTSTLLLFFATLLSLLLCTRALSLQQYSTGDDGIIITATTAKTMSTKLVTISEGTWRAAATRHAERVQSILQPGLLASPPPLLTRTNKKRRQVNASDAWTGLDPLHPIFNFLIEYYGIKGSKGTRRLARWSPDPALLLTTSGGKVTSDSPDLRGEKCIHHQAAMKASAGRGGIFLERANLDDMGGTLHLRGAIPVPSSDDPTALYGILYNPALFYNRHEPLHDDDDDATRRQALLRKIAPFQWYKSILEKTLSSEPIMHCHGLHEWAMLYHPQDSPPPPSAKYQSSLPLRVSRQVINETVQRKGIHCTHVDALRFFAPAAGPLNHHGCTLQRMDQLRLEQKACVHAHMDLLKIALKLQPFVGADLVGDALQVAIRARTLDVEASPYDATPYGAGVVPVETSEGRKMYRERQRALMHEAEPVRKRLLHAYDTFMQLAFEPDFVNATCVRKEEKQNGLLIHHDEVQTGFAGKERFAKAEPGGLPWRRNLLNDAKE